MERISPELADRFQSIVDDPETDALDELWPHVHPNMAQRERARKAVLVTLASSHDKAGMRGRCHTLMVGPPGTGKSELRNWVRLNFNKAHGVGPKSSEAGLKGDASGGSLSPGALSMSHGGMLCIEELDKFAKDERNALYESMSEGEYEVNQAEIRKIVQAEVRTIATCNSLDKFAPAIVDRFDFVIEMDEYDAGETVEVTDTLFSNFMDTFVGGETTTEKALIPQYLKWVDSFEPGSVEEFEETVKKMKNYLIKHEGLTGGIRGKQSWLRACYTIAKLNKRDMTPDDFIRAVTLLEPDLATEETVESLIAIRDGNESEALF
jgi:MoxR-like ATPase